VIIDVLEFSDVAWTLGDLTVLLHDSEESDQRLRDWAEEDLGLGAAYLSLSSSFGVDDGLHSVCQDVDSHCCSP
jgi:hypothetical protein